MSHRIHIICIKPQICSLIKKALSATDYLISCISGDMINENSIKGFPEHVDCLLIDKNIDSKIRKKVKEVFEGTFIIYLPSLESEHTFTNDIKHISEPLKLSELARELEDFFNHTQLGESL